MGLTREAVGTEAAQDQEQEAVQTPPWEGSAQPLEPVLEARVLQRRRAPFLLPEAVTPVTLCEHVLAPELVLLPW